MISVIIPRNVPLSSRFHFSPTAAAIATAVLSGMERRHCPLLVAEGSFFLRRLPPIHPHAWPLHRRSPPYPSSRRSLTFRSSTVNPCRGSTTTQRGAAAGELGRQSLRGAWAWAAGSLSCAVVHPSGVPGPLQTPRGPFIGARGGWRSSPAPRTASAHALSV